MNHAPPTKAREFWISPYNNVSMCGPYVFDKPCESCIHVREVIIEEPGCLGLTMTDKELREEIIELRKDKERLDFIIENEARVEKWLDNVDSSACFVVLFRRNITYSEKFKSPREAIDMAMKQENR